MRRVGDEGTEERQHLGAGRGGHTVRRQARIDLCDTQRGSSGGQDLGPPLGSGASRPVGGTRLEERLLGCDDKGRVVGLVLVGGDKGGGLRGRSGEKEHGAAGGTGGGEGPSQAWTSHAVAIRGRLLLLDFDNDLKRAAVELHFLLPAGKINAWKRRGKADSRCTQSIYVLILLQIVSNSN